MKIKHAERLALNIPFYHQRVTRHMQRAQTHTERVYVYRVETDSGTVGYGDSLSIHDADRLVGQNPFAIMHDDSIGIGPQMAVLDAVGKAAGVPVHALLGTRLAIGARSRGGTSTCLPKTGPPRSRSLSSGATLPSR